jgi:hypothetical protein
MNEVKASIVVMSHLSDAQEMLSYQNMSKEASKHVNFAKYIIIKTSGDLTQQIDADKLWSEFIQQSPDKIYS